MFTVGVGQQRFAYTRRIEDEKEAGHEKERSYHERSHSDRVLGQGAVQPSNELRRAVVVLRLLEVQRAS